MFNTATRIMPRIRALYSSALYDIASATQYVDKTNATYQDTVNTLGGESSAGVEAATDPWGNIRMPNLHALSGFDAREPHRWVDVPWRDSVQNYSSLVGEHLAGLERNLTGNTTFNTTASYLTFSVSDNSLALLCGSCPDRFQCSPWLNFKDRNETDAWFLNKLQKNLTGVMSSTRTQGVPTFLVTFSETQIWNDTTQSHDIIFAGYSDLPNYMSLTQCSPQMTYVDAQVSCTSKGALGKTICGVNAVRETPMPTTPKKHYCF